MSEQHDWVRQRYASHYCEENAYWLAQHAELAGRHPHIVFVSNAERAVPFWNHLLSDGDEPTVWDYHVVVFATAQPVDSPEEATAWCAFDPDTRLPQGCRLRRWLRETWPDLEALPSDCHPRFRVMPFSEYAQAFFTDRSHMLDAHGRYAKPPPDWPPPQASGEAMNLMKFVDVTSDFVGEVMSLSELVWRFATPR